MPWHTNCPCRLWVKSCWGVNATGCMMGAITNALGDAQSERTMHCRMANRFGTIIVMFTIILNNDSDSWKWATTLSGGKWWNHEPTILLLYWRLLLPNPNQSHPWPTWCFWRYPRWNLVTGVLGIWPYCHAWPAVSNLCDNFGWTTRTQNAMATVKSSPMPRWLGPFGFRPPSIAFSCQMRWCCQGRPQKLENKFYAEIWPKALIFSITSTIHARHPCSIRWYVCSNNSQWKQENFPRQGVRMACNCQNVIYTREPTTTTKTNFPVFRSFANVPWSVGWML